MTVPVELYDERFTTAIAARRPAGPPARTRAPRRCCSTTGWPPTHPGRTESEPARRRTSPAGSARRRSASGRAPGARGGQARRPQRAHAASGAAPAGAGAAGAGPGAPPASRRSTHLRPGTRPRAGAAARGHQRAPHRRAGHRRARRGPDRHAPGPRRQPAGDRRRRRPAAARAPARHPAAPWRGRGSSRLSRWSSLSPPCGFCTRCSSPATATGVSACRSSSRPGERDQIADLLEARGVVDSSFFFKLRTRLAGKRGDLQAGTFGLRRDMGYGAVIDALTTTPPTPETIKVTIPEGRSRPRDRTAGPPGGPARRYLEASERVAIARGDYGAPRGRGRSRASCSRRPRAQADAPHAELVGKQLARVQGELRQDRPRRARGEEPDQLRRRSSSRR